MNWQGDLTIHIFNLSPDIIQAAFIDLLQLMFGKEESVFPAKLVKHYFSGNGSVFKIGNVPEQWQEWIVLKTEGKPGKYAKLNPYTKDGPFSLRNSLGHFDVDITKTGNKTLYTIQDFYEFGYLPNDIDGKQRHGFCVTDLGWSQDRIDSFRRRLPTRKYPNPGCGEEEFKFETMNGKTYLMIPREFLIRNGKAFWVTGTFTRS